MLRSKTHASPFDNFKKLCENGQLGKALERLQSWESSGFHVSPSMYHCLLQGCSKEKDITLGRHVLSAIAKLGLFPNATFGAVLIRMFAACSTFQEAQWVFSRLPQPADLLATTAIMSTHLKHGHYEEILCLFAQLHRSDSEMDQHVFVLVLKACASMKSFACGVLIHGLIVEIEFETDTFIGNALVDMYMKCGRLEDGRKLFDALPYPSVVTWTMMIVGFTEQGHGWEALQIFWRMQSLANVESDKGVFVCAIKACSFIGTLDQGQLVHARIVEGVHEKVLTIGNSLVDMYAKCGSLEDAQHVFKSNPDRSLVTWNTMIAAFSHQHGQEQEAFNLLRSMQKDGKHPSNLTWNSMISGLVQQGLAQQAMGLFNKLLSAGIMPDRAIFVSIVKGCSIIPSIELGWAIHMHITEACFDLEITVCNSLIDMYGRCGSLQDARRIFDKSSKKSVVAWTAMIGAYFHSQHFDEALFLFEQMRTFGLDPSYVTFLSMIKGCSNPAALVWGRAIHDHIIKFKFEMNNFIGNCLIDMYSKCGTLEDACCVFEDMPSKCVITWTAIIAGFALNGNIGQAHTLLKQMQHDGVQPNIVTWNAMLAGASEHGYDDDCLHLFLRMLDWGMDVDDGTLVSVLKACGSLALLSQGFLVHCLILEKRLEHDLYVCNSLIDMYVKCGGSVEARSVFNALPKQKVEAWNAMLGGCSERVFGQGFLQGENTFVVRNLSKNSCESLASEEKIVPCSLINDRKYASDTIFYKNAPESQEKHACALLENHFDRDSYSQSGMVSGVKPLNNSESMMDILQTMQAKGSKPDDITFISLLAACCEFGLLQEGCKLFSHMRQGHGITPKLDHFNCLVSLISNAGCWRAAEDLLQTMPLPPDIIGWTSLLCRSHGNIDLGQRCFEQVISLDHRDAAGFEQMSTMYADVGMSVSADQVDDWRQFSNSWKKPGRACVEIDDVAHLFVVGDTRHSQINLIHEKMQSLNVLLKLEGYTPQVPLMHQGADSLVVFQ